MKIQAKQRLKAAPTFTKLFQLSSDIVAHHFKDNPQNAATKKALVSAFNLTVREVGMSCIQNAERFLQKDASPKTWNEALNGKCASKDVCAYAEAFEINYEELS
jgi:hypothetical protein